MVTGSAARSGFRLDADRAVVLLFNRVAEALSRATVALLDQDVDLAESVINEDQEIDKACAELTGRLKEGLIDASGDPEELEGLVDILQMVPELERSADLAEHIAQRTRGGLGGVINAQSRGAIQSMGDVAIGMWRTAAKAYEDRSRDAGITLASNDDELDRLAAQLLDEAATGTDAKVAMDLALIARFYERLGDHAVNLARRIETMAAPRRISTARFAATHRSAIRTAGSGGERRGFLARVRSFRLSPTDEGFFDLFSSAAANARDAADELEKLIGSFSDVDDRVARIRSNELRGDQITVEILRRLDASFVTPYDREDIHELTEELDDVVDNIFAAASLIQLAKIAEPLPELVQQAAVLVSMTDELEALVDGLRSKGSARHRLERIEHLEREGDAIARQALARLFSGEFSPIDVIVWKDIIHAVEESLNAIEDVSDVVESILVKTS